MSDGWVRRQQRTRGEVLAAAGEIIAEHGVDGVTMRKLAERAGVAVATLYNQFGDRQGVFVAFVANGLDQLELELDARPAAAPIDATRALFAGFDEAFERDPDVWRPIFATIKQHPGSHGLGPLGERVVAAIEADLAKAAAEGWFAVDVDTDALARHLFITRMNRIEKWAHGAIDWEQCTTSSRLGLELILAAVLVEPHRSAALAASGVVRPPVG